MNLAGDGHRAPARRVAGVVAILSVVAAHSLVAGGSAESAPTPQPVVVRAEPMRPDGRLTFRTRWRAPSAPRVGIALSGGAAWGQAHIGLLRGMREDGLTPDVIAGTSAGALIGGFVAAGYRLDQIEAIFREQSWNPVFRESPRATGVSGRTDVLDPSLALGETGRRRDGRAWRWRGLVPDRPIFRELLRYFGRAGALTGGRLDSLAVPYRAVACDLESGETFAPGVYPLSTIVRASIGLPILAPVHRDGRVLVDGGVLLNVPAAIAREAGAEFVVAASFLDTSALDLSSFGGILSRSYDLTVASQRQPGIDDADVAIGIDVGELPVSDFDGHLDELIEAGLLSWEGNRERVLAAIERAGGSDRVLAVRRVVPGAGTPDAAARELGERLGARPEGRPVSRLRLELELSRLLNRGGFADGRLELASDGTLKLVLLPEPAVPDVAVEAPESLARFVARSGLGAAAGARVSDVLARAEDAVFAARQSGLYLAGIEEFGWNAETSRLTVRLDDGVIETVRLEGPQGEAVAPVPRTLARLEGRPGTIPTLERALVTSRGRRGEIWHGGGGLQRNESGGYALTLGIDEPPHWTASWTAGIGDEIGPAVQVRLGFPSRAGWSRWNTELRAAASRELVRADLTTSPPLDTPLIPFARASAAIPALRLFDERGREQDLRRFWTASASLGLRSEPTPAGEVELAVTERWTSAKSFFPVAADRTGRDFSFDLLWQGDARDDPLEPRFAASWSLGAAIPLLGDERAWSAVADVALETRLGARARSRVSLLGRVVEAGDAEPLPTDRWIEPGAWWLAPGLDAGRGRARESRRVTLAVRRALGDFFGFNVTGGVSGGLWTLSEERLDTALPDRGDGVSLFFEASTARLGPLTLGVMWSGETKGDRFFLLWSPERAPWPGVPGSTSSDVTR